MLPKKLFIHAALLVGALVTSSSAHAGRDVPPTRFELGLSFEGGAFGMRGDFAKRERAEGGGLFRAPFHIRIGDWEGAAHFFFSNGAAENETFDSYGTSGYGMSVKRYVPLSASASGYGRGRTFFRWDAYVRGGLERLSVNRPDSHTAGGLSYGVGLKFRLQAGRRNGAKASYAVYVDLARLHPMSGPQNNSSLQTFTVGLTLLGVSI